MAAMLGAGREKKEDAIDSTAGIRFLKKTGEQVHEGEPIALLYTHLENRVEEAAARYQRAVTISREMPLPQKLIQARITAENIQYF